MKNIDYDSYSSKYSSDKFLEKVKKWGRVMGVKTVFLAYVLFFTLKAETTPRWVGALIVGALGYLIFPFDIIPDFIPFGYTDDAVALLGLFSGSKSIKQYISPYILKQSKAYLLSSKLFSTTEQELDTYIKEWSLNEMEV